MFFKIGVLKYFAIFTGKIPVLRPLFNKDAGLKLFYRITPAAAFVNGV